jgi:CRP/FNR family transcriptional regulator, cyclic AMP receptor protein
MALHQLLGTIPFLSKLSADQIDALAKAMTVNSYEDGHVFIEEGAAGDGVHLLMEGQVVVGRERDRAWHDLNVLGPGSFFGLVALLDSEHRSATCKAKGPVTVASMNRAVFSVLFGAHAPISMAFQHALAAQLAKDFRNLDRQIKEAFARA